MTPRKMLIRRHANSLADQHLQIFTGVNRIVHNRLFEPVKLRSGADGVCAHVGPSEPVADSQLMCGQVAEPRDDIDRVAGRAPDGTGRQFGFVC